MAIAAKPLRLTDEEASFYHQHGYLRLRQVFTPDEVAQLSDELHWIMDTFAAHGKGWTGAWRQQLMNTEEEQKSVLVTIHELQSYSAAWARAIVNRRLAESVADLIGPEVEFHHSTLHAKGPDFGAPFPMHQDMPFYPHADNRYVDAIVHIDSADEEGGCLKFLDGSHRLGPLEHIRVGSPHLPQDQYRIEDAVSCPAESGDVVLFSIHTIHGSALNRRPRWRRVVRVGYRNPHNRQTGGQAMGRPGIMVHGVRPKVEGVTLDVYGNWGKQAQAPRDDD
jgi:ectoine hydroxylase-related dioxygenase (phytanoyl-CoA dioxygenase family)